MNTYTENNELYHYGIKGMKWGVRRAVQLGSKTYAGVKSHGQNTLDKKADRNDFRSQYHQQRGHKLRAKYYDRKAFKTRDKKFDDNEVLKAGIGDLSLKSERIIAAAYIGAAAVKAMRNL